MDESPIIIDSSLSYEDAIRQNPESLCPEDIYKRLQVIEVKYLSFDKQTHQGQLVMDKNLVQDIHEIFEQLMKYRFPIQSVIPIADPRFSWNDEASMKVNNTSAFNYRLIARTMKVSNHAYGKAIDINPSLNPFIKGDFVQPRGAIYNPSIPGAIAEGSQIVQLFKSKGWEWGGDWIDRKDYQHFQKTE